MLGLFNHDGDSRATHPFRLVIAMDFGAVERRSIWPILDTTALPREDAARATELGVRVSVRVRIGVSSFRRARNR